MSGHAEQRHGHGSRGNSAIRWNFLVYWPGENLSFSFTSAVRYTKFTPQLNPNPFRISDLSGFLPPPPYHFLYELRKLSFLNLP